MTRLTKRRPWHYARDHEVNVVPRIHQPDHEHLSISIINVMYLTHLINEDNGFPCSCHIEHAFKSRVQGRSTGAKIPTADDVQRPLDVLTRSLGREGLA